MTKEQLQVLKEFAQWLREKNDKMQKELEQQEDQKND